MFLRERDHVMNSGPRLAGDSRRKGGTHRYRPLVECLEERRLLSGLSIELIDMNSAGTDSSNTGAILPSISADGRYETYESGSTDLINGLTVTGAVNVYVRDRQTNTTSLVSINTSGTNGGDNDSRYPIISANGSTVVFLSNATDLTANDNPTNNPDDKINVFAWSRATNTLALVSVNYEGTGPGNDPDTQEFGTAADISISANGRYVAFESAATDLVPNIPNINDYTNVYVHDLQTNTTILVSRDVAGTDSGDGPSNNPVISADGTVVAFDSSANNLDSNIHAVVPYTNGQIYARNIATNTTTLVSTDTTRAAAANDTSIFPSLSDDGSVIAFQSYSTDLVTIPDGNTTAAPDVYVRDLAPLSPTRRVSINHTGTASGDAGSYDPVISGNGHFVVFSSLANDLTTNDHGGTAYSNKNVYERNLLMNATTLVSINSSGTNIGDNTSDMANQTFVNSEQQSTGVVSDNGRYVLFISLATDIVPGFVDNQLDDPHYGFDLYLRDTVANTTTLLSHQVGTTNTGGNQISGTAAMTPDGGYVAYQSTAGNLVPVDTNGQTDVFATPAPFNVSPAASQLVVTTQPPSSVTAGSGFGLTIKAEDRFGNVVTSFTGKVTIALANNPGRSTLGGTLTVTAVKGVASFSGLALNKAGSGYALKASSGSLTTTTTAFTVTPAAASQLVVTTQPPSSVTAGGGFGLTIKAEDRFGNVVTSFTGKVTIALANNPGRSTLGGTLTVTAVKGVASFSGLALNKAGSGYALKASSGSLTTTTAFTVAPAAASQLVVTTQPPSSVTAGGGFGLTIKAEDRFGNVVTSFTGKVTIALANNPGRSTLGGTLTVTAVKGVASFSGLALNKAGNGYALKASSGSLTTTTAFTVTPAAASQLVVTTQPPSSVTAGGGFGLTIKAEDRFGNVVTSFTGKVTIALANNPGRSTLGGTLTVTAVKGVASFSGLALNKAGSGYALKASSGSLTTTTAFTVAPAAASQLVVTTQPPSSVTAGGGFGLTIKAEDRFGNVVTSFTGKVTIALANNPGRSTLGGTLTVTAVKGVASFSGLALNKAGSGYTLKATASGLTSATTGAFNVK